MRTFITTIVSILLRFLLVMAIVAAVDALAAVSWNTSILVDGSVYDVIVSAGISEPKIADVPSVAYDANGLHPEQLYGKNRANGGSIARVVEYVVATKFISRLLCLATHIMPTQPHRARVFRQETHKTPPFQSRCTRTQGMATKLQAGQ